MKNTKWKLKLELQQIYKQIEERKKWKLSQKDKNWVLWDKAMGRLAEEIKTIKQQNEINNKITTQK